MNSKFLKILDEYRQLEFEDMVEAKLYIKILITLVRV
jgi:uncharacterized protein (DUF433 family)